MAHLTPYLFFDGNCREAMNFYKSVLGGELFVQTVGDSPVAAQMPAAKDQVIHAMLKNEHLELMASDMIDGSKAIVGNNVDLCLVCSSKEELDRLYAALSDGGKVTMAKKEEFFGWFGSFTDKYGINWMVQYSAENK